MTAALRDDFRYLGLLEVRRQEPFLIHDNWRAGVGADHTATEQSRTRNVIRVAPEVAQLGSFPAYDKQSGTGTDSRPPLASASVGLAQTHVRQRSMQSFSDNALALQSHLVDSVRHFGIAAVPKIVHHEDSNPWQGLDRFARPFFN